MNHCETLLHSASPEATRGLARCLGRALPAGTVIAAYGGLGAGKTLFAAALAEGLGVRETVASPTFVFFRDYAGRIPFCHLDAYRLEGLEEEEKALIGLDDCFTLDKAVFVEWPDFVSAWLPPDTVRLTIGKTGEHSRSLRFCYDPSIHFWLKEALGPCA